MKISAMRAKIFGYLEVNSLLPKQYPDQRGIGEGWKLYRSNAVILANLGQIVIQKQSEFVVDMTRTSKRIIDNSARYTITGKRDRSCFQRAQSSTTRQVNLCYIVCKF